MPRSIGNYRELLLSQVSQRKYNALIAKAKASRENYVEFVLDDPEDDGVEHPVRIYSNGHVYRIREDPETIRGGKKVKPHYIQLAEERVEKLRKDAKAKDQELFELRKSFGALGFLQWSNSPERDRLRKELAAINQEIKVLEKKHDLR